MDTETKSALRWMYDLVSVLLDEAEGLGVEWPAWVETTQSDLEKIVYTD